MTPNNFEPIFTIHVIFVMGHVFVSVELSRTIWEIFLSNDWFCHLIFISICRESSVDYSGLRS